MQNLVVGGGGGIAQLRTACALHNIAAMHSPHTRRPDSSKIATRPDTLLLAGDLDVHCKLQILRIAQHTHVAGRVLSVLGCAALSATWHVRGSTEYY